MKILVFLFFLNFTLLINAQQNRFIYEMSYKKDSLAKNYEKELMCLEVDNNFNSTFFSYVRYKTDSLYTVDEKYDFTEGNIFWRIKKNLKEDLVFETQIMPPTSYTFQDQYKLNWKITNETKIKEAIKLVKAETKFRGRDWIAWFNPDLPILDGPYKFYGLPGLIYEVYDKKETYHFELVKNYRTNSDYFSTKRSIYIENNIDLKRDKYFEIINLYKKDPARDFKQGIYSGKIKLVDKDPNEIIRGIEKRAKEEQKANNNPIELKENQP